MNIFIPKDQQGTIYPIIQRGCVYTHPVDAFVAKFGILIEILREFRYVHEQSANCAFNMFLPFYPPIRLRVLRSSARRGLPPDFGKEQVL